MMIDHYDYTPNDDYVDATPNDYDGGVHHYFEASANNEVVLPMTILPLTMTMPMKTTMTTKTTTTNE